MSNGPVFNIVNQKSDGDTIQGTNITKIVHYNSSDTDISTQIEAVRSEVNGSDIDETMKNKIDSHLEKAIIELGDQMPDKKSIADNIQQANAVLNEVKDASDSLIKIGVKIAEVANWLGIGL